MQNLEIYLNILLLAIYIIVTYYKYYINIVQLFQVHVLMGTKNLPTNKKKKFFSCHSSAMILPFLTIEC